MQFGIVLYLNWSKIDKNIYMKYCREIIENVIL